MRDAVTIRPGDAWGRPGTVADDIPIARSDQALSGLITAGVALAALDAGDLCRTLGGRGAVETRLGGEVTLLDVDVAQVTSDGVALGPAVAHVIARGRAWAGEGFAAMNAQWLRDWDVAPRAHPGDGRLDVVQGRLDLRQRLVARQRVRAGDHLPHPDLQVQRRADVEVSFDRPRRLWMDGVAMGSCRTLRVELVGTVTVVV
jgi:hypothetical protein